MNQAAENPLRNSGRNVGNKAAVTHTGTLWMKIMNQLMEDFECMNGTL